MSDIAENGGGQGVRLNSAEAREIEMNHAEAARIVEKAI
jgi:hypothetical protein